MEQLSNFKESVNESSCSMKCEQLDINDPLSHSVEDNFIENDQKFLTENLFDSNLQDPLELETSSDFKNIIKLENFEQLNGSQNKKTVSSKAKRGLSNKKR